MSLTLFLTITALNHYFIYEDYYFIVYIVVLTLISKQFCRNYYRDIILYSLEALTMVSMSNITSLFIISLIFDIKIFDIIHQGRFAFILSIVLSKILYFLFTINGFKWVSDTKYATSKYFLNFLVIIFMARACLTNFESILFKNTFDQTQIIIAIFQLAILVTGTLSLFDKVQRDNKIEINNLQILEMLSKYKNIYDVTKESSMDAKIIKHDVNNYLTIIRNYLVNKQNEKALKYINSLLTEVKNIKYMIYTGNVEIDWFLSIMKQISQNKNIKFQLLICEITFNKIDSNIFIVMLANIINNAIENIGNQKNIIVSIEQVDKYISVVVKNSINESVLLSNKKLKTTKTNEKNHGYGVLSIKNTVKQYNGEIIFEEDSGYFICSILLKND